MLNYQFSWQKLPFIQAWFSMNETADQSRVTVAMVMVIWEYICWCNSAAEDIVAAFQWCIHLYLQILKRQPDPWLFNTLMHIQELHSSALFKISKLPATV